jgi:hypothetical protein
MIRMREFTKGDWARFSGAEAFADGTQPLIGRCEVMMWMATVIAHGPGVLVSVEVDERDTDFWGFASSPTVFGLDCGKEEAIAVARALPIAFTLDVLEAAGFREI